MKPRSRYRGLTLFLTVGSTRFDKLVSKILTQECANQLVGFGFNRLILQVGGSDYDSPLVEQIKQDFDLDIEIYDYKSNIFDDINRSDIILSHAGAGTCLEVLRMNKRLLIVVNEELMDNHQTELADRLSSDGYAFKTTVEDLSENLAHVCDSEIRMVKFPAQEESKFEEIFNKALKDVAPTKL